MSTTCPMKTELADRNLLRTLGSAQEQERALEVLKTANAKTKMILVERFIILLPRLTTQPSAARRCFWRRVGCVRC